MSLKKSKGNMYDWVSHTHSHLSGKCGHQCGYCLDGETNILMSDGTQKPIKNIVVGDKIVGAFQSGKFDKYVVTTVLAKVVTVQDAYKITTENKTSVICGSEHRWKSSRGWKYTTKGKIERRPYLTTSILV